MNFSLRLKFGCLIALVVSWCLFMVYLVTTLEFQWMPPLPLLQSIQHNTADSRSVKRYVTSESSLLNLPTSPPSSVVQILIACDGKSLGGLIAAMNSVISNTKHTVKFYIVITMEDLPHLKMWIQSSKLHSLNYETYTLTAAGNKALAELHRVKVNFGQLFPKLEGRVIYLDSDVIVQGDIWELFSFSIEPNTYGAFALDCSSSSSRMAGAIGRPKYATFINMKHSQLINKNINGGLCPFAVGVFVANVSEWKEKKVFEQLQMWLEIHSVEPITGIHPTVDEYEAAMLIHFYRKVTPLDPLWHIQHLGIGLSSRYSKQFIEHAKLLHWNGHFKPWRHFAAHTKQWDHYFVPDPTLQFRPVRRRG